MGAWMGLCRARLWGKAAASCCRPCHGLVGWSIQRPGDSSSRCAGWLGPKVCPLCSGARCQSAPGLHPPPYRLRWRSRAGVLTRFKLCWRRCRCPCPDVLFSWGARAGRPGVAVDCGDGQCWPPASGSPHGDGPDGFQGPWIARRWPERCPSPGPRAAPIVECQWPGCITVVGEKFRIFCWFLISGSARLIRWDCTVGWLDKAMKSPSHRNLFPGFLQQTCGVLG
jgi:hypothetical protein